MLADRRVRDDWQTFGLMYVQTLALNVGTGQLVKGVAKRTRPYVYNPEVPIGLKTTAVARKSFYSSHTSFAFASAVFMTTTLSDYGLASGFVPYAVGLAFLGATTVGILPYVSGRHFPTDILVGAAAGSLIGWVIPALHRTQEEVPEPGMHITFTLAL